MLIERVPDTPVPAMTPVYEVVAGTTGFEGLSSSEQAPRMKAKTVNATSRYEYFINNLLLM
jgi:hypothetical protein